MKSLCRNLIILLMLFANPGSKAASQPLPDEFRDPPHEFTLIPFWFWNDTLRDEEIVKQIADFENHGVYGFVIHPRIGLPANTGWLSPAMIHAMRIAIEEAARRGMYVVLYDEGMYPSGSSSGQVVTDNPEYAARGLAKIDLEPGEDPVLPTGAELITIAERPDGGRIAVIEKPSGGVIRGLHYTREEKTHFGEESPPAADILNPEAAASFIKHVYDRYAAEFGRYFGNTIPGIFTDEPLPLGRNSEKGMMPGNSSVLAQTRRILGYDLIQYLADLWYDDGPDALKHRTDYFKAVNICLGENYYSLLDNWTREHGISLMGHPAGSMDIGLEKYFGIPGQDLVWRYVEPGPKALQGEHSTMAKCASSAMENLGLRRNSNELYGAYGHNLTFAEIKWLAGWCFVRGHNMLFPHAFYYSLRGPRFDERPPDVGPNAPWWNEFKPFADACRRLSWINTDSKHVCSIAILCEASFLPDRTAEMCYRHQKDFNYLEADRFGVDASVDEKGIHVAGMNYQVLIADSVSQLPDGAAIEMRKLASAGRLIIRRNDRSDNIFEGSYTFGTEEELNAILDEIVKPDIILLPSCVSIRYRHVIKGSDHYYIIFNEEEDELNTKVSLPLKGIYQWLDPFTAETEKQHRDGIVHFGPYELKVLRVIPL
jgi:hypothetical protein